jgi:hypothetical protein
VIGKPIALIQVPNQRLFTSGHAARYLGISKNTLAKVEALGLIQPINFIGRRGYKLEDLDRLIDTRPAWEHGAGENPGRSLEETHS